MVNLAQFIFKDFCKFSIQFPFPSANFLYLRRQE